VAYLLFRFEVASVGALALLGFLLSFSQSFFDPALNRSIRGLVGTDDLSRAIGYTASTASFANLFGAVISASLMGFLGLEQVPLITAMGYLISGSVLCLTPFQEVRGLQNERPGHSQNQRTDFTKNERSSFFKFLFLNTAVLNFFTVPVVILLPLVTDRVLRGNSSVLAGLEASLFAGFILGSLGSGWAAKRDAIQISAFALLLMGVSYGIIALGKSPFSIATGLLLAGTFVGLNNARMMTFFHQLFPEEKKGKFFATLNAYCNIAVPLGYALFGALADVIPLSQLIAFEGAGIVFTAVWLLKLRSYDKP
ncbi:MAG: MFS transporter, partial [Bdellovibrionales bacterium]|nr:MFS transporter [Bdellovibrionales bacterium]